MQVSAKMTEEDSNWLFKNKGHGMISAAASLGMVMLWNVDESLKQIDKYFHHNEDFAKAGACLGVGIISSGVRNEYYPALALLSEFVDNTLVFTNVRQTSILGLGLAYAGSQRDEIRELLEGIIFNTDITEASLFLVRIAQGLNAMGKGLKWLNPFLSVRYNLVDV